LEFVHFVAQSDPTGPLLASKKFKIRTGAERLDPSILFVRLSGMLTSRRNDQFTHIARSTLRIAATA
jgi:hypothetical protein